MFDETTLQAYLQRLGWKARPHGDSTWRTTQRVAKSEDSKRRPEDEDSKYGPEDAVTIYLRLSDNWLIASVVPFLSTGGKNSFELSRWLLRMNRDMLQTKFAYDEDGDVVLTVEVPTESLDFGEFESALTGLLEATVEHRATLLAAAAPSSATTPTAAEGDA